MYRKVRPEWYTKNVTEKRNETWSLHDRMLVYTLRINDQKSIGEIVEALKKRGKRADRVAVYNLIRQSRKALLGRCFKCGNDLTEQELNSRKQGRILFLCTKCKKESQERKRQRRKNFLKKGLCGTCGKRPYIPGNTSCQKCISTTNRRRIVKGLCGTCGKYPIDKKKSIHQCCKCLKLNRAKKPTQA